MRVDRWLWAARLYKTRTASIAACDAGHVKVNGQAARPARPVRPGDRVEAMTPGGKRILVVMDLGLRRGSAQAAQALYEDLTPPPPPALPEVSRWDRHGARPTRQQRRELDRLRGR